MTLRMKKLPAKIKIGDGALTITEFVRMTGGNRNTIAYHAQRKHYRTGKDLKELGAFKLIGCTSWFFWPDAVLVLAERRKGSGRPVGALDSYSRGTPAKPKTPRKVWKAGRMKINIK